MRYDIIGDIHGHALTLTALLEKLGYSRHAGIYQHPERKVIFLGDFIDRGAHQRQTLDTVRPMIDAGHALAVMGNHEFNAVAYATPLDERSHLRPRNPGNEKQHAAFLAEYPVDSPDYLAVIDWFKTLPLWLDLGDLRVVHACWDKDIIARLEQHHKGPRLTNTLLRHASTKGRQEYEDVEILLKGKEIRLPDGHSYFDSYGKERHYMRMRWWDRTSTTYRGKFLGMREWETHIPDDEIDGDHGITYGHHEPPVFLGHYWQSGTPAPFESNVACLDYSVAKPGGKLVAYRWNGEQHLHADAFVWVDRVER
jgi:hypothetical protein